MFYRRILAQFEHWKNNPDRKPLVLRGARQVGKTTAVHLFSEQFANYIYLNLEIKEDRDLFTEDLAIKELFQAILVIKNIKLKEGDTLLFIDEVQNSAVAIRLLRYFYEDFNKLYVIAAGSLLEVMLDEHNITFPVGRVEFAYLYPLSFEEFLEAINENQLLDVYRTVPLKRFAYAKLLALFHRYTMIGGLPEIVQQHIKREDVASLKPYYESLLTSYLDDSAKYARNSTMRHVLKHTIESLPYESGKRIKFQGFGKSNYKSREVGEALRTIARAMLIYLIYPTTSVEPPPVPDHRKSPKLQFIDTGLLNYFVGLQPRFFQFADLHAFYRGAIAEHIVRQEIIAQDLTANRSIPFWVREKNQSSAEVDILLPFRGHLIPVEVKSGKSGTLRSLHQFVDLAPHSYAVRLYEGGFEVVETATPKGKRYKLLNLPYFLAGRIYDYLELFLD